MSWYLCPPWICKVDSDCQFQPEAIGKVQHFGETKTHWRIQHQAPLLEITFMIHETFHSQYSRTLLWMEKTAIMIPSAASVVPCAAGTGKKDEWPPAGIGPTTSLMNDERIEYNVRGGIKCASCWVRNMDDSHTHPWLQGTEYLGSLLETTCATALLFLETWKLWQLFCCLVVPRFYSTLSKSVEVKKASIIDKCDKSFSFFHAPGWSNRKKSTTEASLRLRQDRFATVSVRDSKAQIQNVDSDGNLSAISSWSVSNITSTTGSRCSSEYEL